MSNDNDGQEVPKPSRLPCAKPCKSKQGRCTRDTELCGEEPQMYCKAHCPCKQKLGTRRKKRKYNKNKANCDECNPKLVRCAICQRCSACCYKAGLCQIIKTPAPKRSNHASVVARIQRDAIAKTPVATKLETGELEQTGNTTEARLFDLLGINRASFHNMPPESKRRVDDALEKILSSENAVRAREELVQVFGLLYKETAKVLLPNGSEWLLNEHFLKLSKAKGKDMTKKGRILEGITKEVMHLAKNMPSNTMGYRIARAILVCNASNGDLFKNFDEMEPPKFGRAARKRGEEDMKRARKEKKDPQKKRRTVARVDNANIMRMVKHVLSFVQTLSWGTKNLRQQGKNETIVFPKLTRTAPVQVMFEDFAKKEAQLKAVELDEKIQPPQRTLYFRIAAELTSKAEKSISCIDYVMDILVNTPVSVLVTIIEQLVAPTQQARMKKCLRKVQHFLKYQYDSHLSSDSSEICSHNIKYALGLPSSDDDCTASSTTYGVKTNEHCPGCKFVAYFMLVELPNAIEANRSKANGESADDALRYIEDSLEKFRLYQGHRVRVVNQQLAIEKINIELQEQVLKSGRDGTIVKITIDFKQKYLEKRLRSSQMNDFGQRGITWHIVIIEYYKYEAPCAANNNKARAVRVQVPLDQILNSGNKQDGPCVLAMLEAMLKMIKVELPSIKEVILVSDNAGCYHSKDMIFPICILNQLALNQQPTAGPLIVKYIHPETQDGKGPCDSHAAVAGRHVDQFLCTRKDGTLTFNQACTPTEVATALCSNGGMKNSAVQLIKLDFPRLAKISKLCAGADKAALEYFARANEIRFFPELDRHAKWATYDLMDERNWATIEPVVQVMNYSNISEGTVFKIGFAKWQEGEGSFTAIDAPDRNPNWKKEQESQLIGRQLLELTKRNLSSQEISQSLLAQARMHLKVARVANHLYEHAIAALTQSKDAASDISNDDDEIHESDVEDDESMLEEEDDCLESFFEIERALETRLEVEENAFQYDQSWESDVEDDGSSDDDNGGDEEDLGRQSMVLAKPEDSMKVKTTALVEAPKQHYSNESCFTGVAVTHHKPFTSVVPVPPKKKEGKTTKKLVEEWDSHDALSTAIGLAGQYVNSPDCSIRPAEEEDFDTYKIADGWTHQSLNLTVGWARRPLTGKVYGKKYMNDDFMEICIEQFNRGFIDKGDKQSPSQTLEVIKEQHCGLYCYPGVHEILRTFNGLVQKVKKGGKVVMKKKKQTMPPEIKAEVQSLVEANPLMKGLAIFGRWKEEFGSKHKEYDREKIMYYANYLRGRKNKSDIRRFKRSMAG